jgi:UDP-N-acetylmuramate-alanine ligase
VEGLACGVQTHFYSQQNQYYAKTLNCLHDRDHCLLLTIASATVAALDRLSSLKGGLAFAVPEVCA